MHEYALENIHERLPTLEEVVRVVPLENSSVMLCAVCHRQLAPAFAFCPYCTERKMGEDLFAPRHVSILEMGVVEK
jgi:hypothetical protein